MSFLFKPASRENVSLLIGLAGSSGSGKTYTAMRLAKGICGDKPFAVIDTEAGRAKHYADLFKFDHCDLAPPFRPDTYKKAIAEADKQGYHVIIVDSMSHEHAGDGGILDWQEEELSRMAGDNWEKRNAYLMASWIKPKMGHKKMVQSLLQVRAHLILCFRAEEKIEMIREGGKIKVVPKHSPVGLGGWIPICEKNLPYELTCSFLLTADKPGIPQPIKLQEQHKPFFQLDKPITEDSGKLIAKWAAGGKQKTQSPLPMQDSAESENSEEPAQAESIGAPTDFSALRTIMHGYRVKFDEAKKGRAFMAFLGQIKVKSVDEIKDSDLEFAIKQAKKFAAGQQVKLG